MPPWVADRWWDLGKLVMFGAMSSLFSFRFAGGQHVPRSGPVLVLSNHQSFLDPVLVGLAIPRYVRFVHRETLQKSRKLTWLMASLRAIPIDHRGFSREGLQATLEALGQGDCVGMFPEGERTHNGEVAAFKPGISLLIKRTTAPIVPVGIAGAFEAWPRTSKWPRPAPIWRTPSSSTIAVAVGRVIDPVLYRHESRELMLEQVQRSVQQQVHVAQRLRRETRSQKS